MHDLTIETALTCATNVHFETTVPGSKPGTTYTVTWGRTYDPKASYQYDWSCTCHAFKFGGGKPCKHIKAVEASKARCGWNGCLEPFVTPGTDANGEPCCPECGGPVEVFRVGV
jgi:hypothetical protein